MAIKALRAYGCPGAWLDRPAAAPDQRHDGTAADRARGAAARPTGLGGAGLAAALAHARPHALEDASHLAWWRGRGGRLLADDCRDTVAHRHEPRGHAHLG